MKRYNYLLFFSAFVSVFSCVSDSETENTPKEKEEKSNSITIIFQAVNTIDTLERFPTGIRPYNQPAISYNNKYAQSSFFKPANLNESDTITIPLDKEFIWVKHYYYQLDGYNFLLHRGDTVVFNYENGVPVGTIANRSTLPYSVNFEKLKREHFSQKGLQGKSFFNFHKFDYTDEEIAEFSHRMLASLSKEDKFLDSLHAARQIDSLAYVSFKNRIVFEELDLRYWKNLKFYFGKQPLLNSELLAKEELLPYSYYTDFVKSYATDYIYKWELADQNKGHEYNPALLFDSAQVSPQLSGGVKEYLLFDYLQQIAERNSLDDFNNYFNNFKSLVNDTSYINYLTNTYLVDLNEAKYETETLNLVDSKKRKTGLEEILAKHKGKVIYIDLWASWCTPCRVAMPASYELAQSYAGDEVVFIYLSIDTDFEKWQLASVKEKIQGYSENYLVVNADKASYFKELKFQSIPRYLLYDRAGNLVHKNAPGPGGEEIRKLLDKYLAKENEKVSSL